MKSCDKKVAWFSKDEAHACSGWLTDITRHYKSHVHNNTLWATVDFVKQPQKLHEINQIIIRIDINCQDTMLCIRPQMNSLD